MPRKYEPTIKTEYSPWGGSDYSYAEMQEDKNGEWIPLKVFEDEQRRLNSMIEKLKKQLSKHQES